MISKKDFCKAIGAIKEYNEFTDELNAVFNKFNSQTEIWCDNKIENAMIELLSTLFKDKSDYIGYWCYELNFGEGYEPNTITDTNGNDIPLKTAEDLYDLLVSGKNVGDLTL